MVFDQLDLIDSLARGNSRRATQNRVRACLATYVSPSKIHLYREESENDSRLWPEIKLKEK